MSGMKLTIKAVTRLTSGLVFVFGFFLTLQGHLNIGGGIAGGMIIALASFLNVLAFGKRGEDLDKSRQRALFFLSLGLGLFCLLSVGGYFLNDPLPKGNPGQLLSGGLIPAYNIIMLMIIGGGVYLALLDLVSFKIEAGDEEGK